MYKMRKLASIILTVVMFTGITPVWANEALGDAVEKA